MGGVLAQSNTINQTGQNKEPTVTLKGVGSGNAIIIIVNYNDSSGGTNRVANVFDNVATATAYTIGSATNGIAENNGKSNVQCFYRTSVAAGDYLIKANGLGTTLTQLSYTICAMDVSGLNGTFDSSGSSGNGNNNSAGTGPVTNTSPGWSTSDTFILAAGGYNNFSDGLASPGGSWVTVTNSDAQFPALFVVYQNVTSSAGVTANFGTLTASEFWEVLIAGFEFSAYSGIVRFCANGHVQANTIAGSVALPTNVVMRIGANGVIQVSGPTSTSVGKQIRICANGQLQANVFD